jgi:SOS-response transcriptional repressor LexA
MKTDSTAATRVLGLIQDHYAKQRAMPTFAQVAQLAGISVSTAAFHIESLKASGYLSATDTGRLTPGKAFFQRVFAGYVRAGVPAYADASAGDGLLIDEYLVDAPSRTFLLTVKGESMSDAGLLPGDTVVVKRGAVAEPGDIVVVDANGEGTIKELARNAGGELFLRARNPAFADIWPVDGFELMGVVVGQFRRYARGQTRTKAPANVRPIRERSRCGSAGVDLSTGRNGPPRPLGRTSTGCSSPDLSIAKML